MMKTLFIILLCCASWQHACALSFKGSSPSVALLHHHQPSSLNNNIHWIGSLAKSTKTYSVQDHHLKVRGGSGDTSNDESLGILQKCVLLLNASSKWLLALANLYGVIRYRDPGAFLCIGCILACFGTEHVLKPAWNQARPSRAPLVGPGMPSSHSLGSFFMAIGWSHILRDLTGNDPLFIFLGISSMVASLRIICGYHTLAQVLVGAVLGLVSGHGWMDWIWTGCGIREFLYTHAAIRWTIWSSYVLGSLLFIWKIMSKWIDRRMLLH